MAVARKTEDMLEMWSRCRTGEWTNRKLPLHDIWIVLFVMPSRMFNLSCLSDCYVLRLLFFPGIPGCFVMIRTLQASLPLRFRLIYNANGFPRMTSDVSRRTLPVTDYQVFRIVFFSRISNMFRSRSNTSRLVSLKISRDFECKRLPSSDNRRQQTDTVL